MAEVRSRGGNCQANVAELAVALKMAVSPTSNSIGVDVIHEEKRQNKTKYSGGRQ